MRKIGFILPFLFGWFSPAVYADDLADIEAVSDQWWGLWTPIEEADLDLAYELEKYASGWAFKGRQLRAIDDKNKWRGGLEHWLSTLKSLEYYPVNRSFKLEKDVGVEQGLYYENKLIKTARLTVT